MNKRYFLKFCADNHVSAKTFKFVYDGETGVNSKSICERTGKMCLSKKEAGILKNNAAKSRNKQKHIPKRAYYCDYCGTYHLTHYKKRDYDKSKFYKRWK